RIATNRIVAAGIAEATKLLEQSDQRQSFPRRLALVRRKQSVKFGTPGAHLRKWLRLPLVPELRRLGTDDLPDHLARYAKFPADRLDRLTMNKIGATDTRNRIHTQHPNLGFHDVMEATVDPCPGVPIGCRLPRIRGPYSMPKHKLREDRTDASRINETWAMDFVHDQLATGRKIRVLTIVDTFSRFSPTVDPRFGDRDGDVVLTLERICKAVGFPKTIRVDQGSEFVSRDLDIWAYQKG